MGNNCINSLYIREREQQILQRTRSNYELTSKSSKTLLYVSSKNYALSSNKNLNTVRRKGVICKTRRHTQS